MKRAALFVLPLLALTGCGGAPDDSTVTTVQNAQSGEAETVIKSDSGWTLTASQSAGATALYSDDADVPMLAISCPIRHLMDVTLAGAQPLASDAKLTIRFGSGAPVELNAVATIDRNGSNSVIPGAMKASGATPDDLRSQLQSGDIAISYGGRSFGPFPTMSESVRQRLLSEC